MINIQIHSDIIKMQTYKEEKENHSNWREVEIIKKRVAISLSSKLRNGINIRQIGDGTHLREDHTTY
jgi:hypothetical protein